MQSFVRHRTTVDQGHWPLQMSCASPRDRALCREARQLPVTSHVPADVLLPGREARRARRPSQDRQRSAGNSAAANPPSETATAGRAPRTLPTPDCSSQPGQRRPGRNAVVPSRAGLLGPQCCTTPGPRPIWHAAGSVEITEPGQQDANRHSQEEPA